MTPTSIAVGIDLGTTNSVLAVLRDFVEVVPNKEGSSLTPSVVSFTEAGEVLVGDVATRQAHTNAEGTFASVKRRMGTSWVGSFRGADIYPQEISARILQKLKADAEEYLGQDIQAAVITVPAYFNDSQRQATKEAGEIAGLEVLRIINEPTAAALAYGLDKAEEDKLILVYDLGGGTFDVSLLQFGAGVVEVKATAGDNKLGGDDWDEALANFLARGFCGLGGVPVQLNESAFRRLLVAARQAKLDLSSANTAIVSLPYLANLDGQLLDLETTVSRADFERVTEHLLAATRGPLEQVLRDASIAKEQIDEVLLVGGSTRMPQVTALIEEVIGIQPSKGINPDEVVALGAALQAGVLLGQAKDVLLLDVIPISVGVEISGGVMSKMIERNTMIPVTVSDIFSTARDNQESVVVKVFQGEKDITVDNFKIGHFHLSGIRPAPKGQPRIEVTFDVGPNGILQVSAMDLDTGFAQNITIDETNMVSPNAIAQMKQRLSGQGLDSVEVQRPDKGLKLLDDVVDQPSAAQSAALRVFISHASPDSLEAQDIARALGEVGVNTWLASRDVKAGQNFAQSIIEAIEGSTHLLVLLTEDSLKSPHVKREVNHAIDQQKLLLPVFRNVPIDVKRALPPDWRYWLGIAQAIVWDEEADIGQNLKRHLEG